MLRIAVGGFQHETNTFAPSKAQFADFEQGGGWPPLLQGADLFDGVAGINLPMAGFVEAMGQADYRLIPTAWAAASPSAHVTQDAFERIAGMITRAIQRAGSLDAVYLDLHGAMVTEHCEDGEGELLDRVRRIVGPEIPVVASLDLHANVTRRMLRHAEILIAYRTYPHVDMAETGARVAHYLKQRLKGAAKPAMAASAIPFLIPLQAQSTLLEPAQSLYRELASMEGQGCLSLSFTPGFPAADFAECGALAFAYATIEAQAQGVASALARRVEACEAQFDAPVYAPEECVQRALRIARSASRPVVIADTQDNPGAGGDSDTTGVLRALVGAGVENAALGLMVDAQAAQAAHAVGVGGTLEIALGGRSHIPGDAPLHARYQVEALSDGNFICTGPFYRGARMRLGPCARLRIGGVKIVVASQKVQLADQQMFRFVGIDPRREAILVVKSSAHFRADFGPIAQEILLCKAPGPMLADPSEYPWQHLRSGLRLKPLGAPFLGAHSNASNCGF